MQSYFYMWSSFNFKRVEFVLRQQRDCDVRYKNQRLRLSSILFKRTIHLQIVCYVKVSFDALTPCHDQDLLQSMLITLKNGYIIHQFLITKFFDKKYTPSLFISLHREFQRLYPNPYNKCIFKL